MQQQQQEATAETSHAVVGRCAENIAGKTNEEEEEKSEKGWFREFFL